MNVPERIRVRAMVTYNDETYKVKRGNVSLRVSKNEVQKYFDLGYDVYSLDGKLIKQAVPKDVPTLQKAFLDNQIEIKRLKDEIAELKAQLEKGTSSSTKKTAATTKKAKS